MSNNVLSRIENIEGLEILSEAEAASANGGFSFGKFFGSLLDGSFFDAVTSAVTSVKTVFGDIGGVISSFKSLFSFF